MTRERTRNRILWGLYALLLALTALAQDTVLGPHPVAGVHLCLMPVTVACVAVFAGAEKGALCGLIAGTVWALGGTADGGAWIVCLTVCGAASGYLCDAVFTRRLAAGVLMSLMSLILTLGPILLIRLYLDGGEEIRWILFLRQVILSLPTSLPIYGLCVLIRKVGG